MILRTISAALVTALLTSAVTAQVPYTVSQYGPTCGPLAQAVVTPRGNNNFQFNLTLSEAQPQMHVLLIVGINQTAIPIDFGMSCLLLTDLLYSEVHTTDLGGAYTWHELIPSGFPGPARFQFAEVDFCLVCGRLIVRTSNGVTLTRA